MTIKLIDVGAANYKLEERWLFLQHNVDVVLFEPDLRSYKELSSEGANIYNFALGEKTTVQQLNLTRKKECSSFYTPNMKYLSKFPNKDRWDIVGCVDVNVRTLDSFDLDAEFIKLDTQGSELDILKGAEKTIKSVLGLQVEVSFLEIYQDQPLFGEVCEFLLSHGFEFFEFITEYRYGRKELNRKGQLAFADALFLRPPELVEKMSLEKQKKYTSIVKAYGKEDLAI
ncbi:MAG: FkbM family methyltransferase [Methylomarinum sp.]|nr:FkbM family methyltransferase [Methylomarinum sp.]